MKSINTEDYKIINTFKDPLVSHQQNDLPVAYLNYKILYSSHRQKVYSMALKVETMI